MIEDSNKTTTKKTNKKTPYKYKRIQKKSHMGLDMRVNKDRIFI